MIIGTSVRIEISLIFSIILESSGFDDYIFSKKNWVIFSENE